MMAKYLTYKSTRLFLKLSKICYLTGSLSCSQFMERLALLRMMCSPKNPSGIYAERVLSREKIELNDVWFDDVKRLVLLKVVRNSNQIMSRRCYIFVPRHIQQCHIGHFTNVMMIFSLQFLMDIYRANHNQN